MPSEQRTRGVRQLADGLDQRYQLAKALRRQITHVFPKHHSFLWGEFALYSFVLLVLSGTFLSLFFVPDTTETVYNGPYDNLRGLHVSRAYESTLQLSFEVRGGLFIRQMHHWAAHAFVISTILHMCRNYFTGAFRKPRELTWLTGVALLALAIPEGYLGYSMLDDLLSGVGVRIVSGLLLSVPVIGTWLHWLVFGGEFEGELWISRFFLAHVFLIPGAIIALVALHLALVWYQKHTHFPGPGARESNVVGDRAAPSFFGKTLANGLCVVGILSVTAAIFQINPVFLWGPYNPDDSSAGVQPDWYLGFFIGALRLFPRWDIDIGPYTVPAPFWPGLFVPLVMFLLLAAQPLLDKWLFADRGHHHLLQRPRDNSVRTGLGAMALTFYVILFIAGADDVHSLALKIPYEWIVWGGRIGLLVLPPLSYVIAARVCVALQRSDRDVLARGARTGEVRQTSEDTYAEIRQPAGGVDLAGRPKPMDYGGARVSRDIAAERDDEDDET